MIGAFSAQSIADHFETGKNFWFLGAFLGGIIAWIGVDVRKFIAGVTLAVKHAWQQTIAWKPNVEHWKNVGRLYLLGLSCFSTCVTCFMLVDHSNLFDQQNGQGQGGLHLLEMLLYVLFAAASFLFLLAAALCTVMSFELKNAILFSHEEKQWIHLLTLNMNPVGLTIFLLKSCVQFVRWSLFILPFALQLTWLFFSRAVRLTFLYANHERRTASFVFAALGASIGYFVGHVPIVALVGAVLGVLEFELTKSLRERMLNPLRATI